MPSAATAAKLAQRTTMRLAMILAVTVGCAACAGASTAPSSVSAGTTMNVAGTWNGTIASSNNDTEQVRLLLTQTGADIVGTWASTSVSWSGQVTATVNSSTIDGTVTFAGTAANGAVCNGTATVTGTASETAMTLTSAAGVIGAACPAPLPTGITIDVHRQ
jgi:hypothetical protein